MNQIADGIFYEDSFLGVTLGLLIFPQGVVAIDAPLKAEDARAWRAALMNQRTGSNRLLISLDAHPDRTLGTRALDCTVVSHIKTAQVYKNRPSIFKGQSVESGAVWETYSEAIGLRWSPPDITFTHRMSLYLGGPEVVLEHRPGPAPGAIWVIVPEMQVVFVGDAVVLRQPPFLAHADLESWIEMLDELLSSYRNFTIVCGRGGVASSEDIQLQRSFLVKLVEGLERLVKKEAPTEAAQELIPSLFSLLKLPSETHELFLKRLRHGLGYNYARRLRSASLTGLAETEDVEQ